MKTNSKYEVIARIAGQSLVLAALLAMVLSTASISGAQSNATPPATQAAKPAPAQKAPALAAAKPPAKGESEGIKVHGHWTIEIKNPDGKLVTHREFENSLVNSPIWGNGAGLLAGILDRSATIGPWQITLADPTQTNFVWVYEPNSQAYAGCAAEALQQQQQYGFFDACSNNLSVTGAQYGTNSGFTGSTLTLTGSGVVPQGYPATIGFVATSNWVCPPSQAPSACATGGGGIGAGFTTRTLDGQNGDPAAVPVSAGQTAAVTVVISFQ